MAIHFPYNGSQRAIALFLRMASGLGRVLDCRSPFTHPSAVPISGRRSLVQSDNSASETTSYAAQLHAGHRQLAT